MVAHHPAVPDFKPGDHVCPLVEGEAEHLPILARFILLALERGERFIIGSKESELEQLLSGLSGHGVEVDRERASGALDVLIAPAGVGESESFSPRGFLDFLVGAEGTALVEGYTGLGFAGVNSMLDLSTEVILETEGLMNELVKKAHLAVMCLYDRSRFDPAVIHDALRAHPLVCLKDRRMSNPFFEPPDMLMDPGTGEAREFKRRRVIWWIERLEAATRAEAEKEARVNRALQSERMAAVRLLAGGIAHDFNNLLTTISGFADLLTAEIDPDSPSREYADEILKASHRAAELTEKLLTFSRNRSLRPRVTDVRQVVHRMRGLLREMLGSGIELVVTAGEQAATVRADPARIDQMVLNLALNARDAMPEGGRLGVAVDVRTLERPRLVGSTELPAGEWVTLSVSDTGRGIPPESQSYVFEPFFTTKEQRGDRGTGLGLAIVHGIVHESGGEIHLESRVGEGTTFTVFLPRVESAPARAHARKLEAARSGEGKTVLVVEDQDSVRTLLSRLLPRLGYHVLLAEEGVQALEVYREHAEEIDLVLSDVMMPEMGGGELGELLRAEDPALPIVFMSGYTEELPGGQEGREASAEILKKPFTVDELDRRLQKALRL